MNIFETIWNYLTRPKDDFVHGALLPTPEKVAFEPKFDEMVAKINPVNWKPLDLTKLPDFPVRNQNGASACVAFTVALICSILYFIRTGVWVDFSPMWIYSKRVNKPEEGMIGTDAFKIAQDGILPDVLMPSDSKTEAEMNTPKLFSWFNKVAEIFGLDTRLVLIVPIKDIETIASIIQTTGKPVMVWFDFGPSEWVKVPKVLSTYTPWRHSVTAIPPINSTQMTFGIYEGEKAIVIQDSWGKDLETIGGRRVIKQSFFNTRNIFAAYPIQFKFDTVTTKPHYDGSTKSLQDCLKHDGDFPTNIESTGLYGSITTDSVKKFQAKYSIDQTGTVGPKTTAKLQELYP